MLTQPRPGLAAQVFQMHSSKLQGALVMCVAWALCAPLAAQNADAETQAGELQVAGSEPAAEPTPDEDLAAPSAPVGGSDFTTTSSTSAPSSEAATAMDGTGTDAAPVAESGFALDGPGFDMQPMAPRPRYDLDVPEDSTPVRGWFRFDVDRQGPRFWVGAVHALGAIDIASDIYFDGAYAVLDVGVVLGVGPVSFLPMVGMGFNFAEAEAANIIGPQLFTILDTDPVYFESWVQLYFNEVFGTYAGRLRGPGNQFYTRNFLLYNVSDHFAIGPQMELTYDFSAGEFIDLPVGGGVNVHYGDHNTLALYLGYDTQAGDTDRLAGRFTFIRTW